MKRFCCIILKSVLEYVSTFDKRVKILEKQKKNALHKGHRDRIKQRYMKTGIDGFQEHEILEMLLFFGIPFKDTNALAHELINNFGSLEGVLKAPPESLNSFKNMTKNSVVLLKLVSDICKMNSEKQKIKPKRVNSIEDIKRLLLDKYYGIDREVISLILLDNKNKIIDCMTLVEGSDFASEVVLGDITRIANSRGVTRIMIAHNHPDNKGVSVGDITATKKALFYLKGVNMELCESFVVTNTKVIEVSKVIEKNMNNNQKDKNNAV